MVEQSMQATRADASHGPPLCVDLDGTLIAGDALWESVLALLRTKPLLALLLPWWLMRGKAGFKRAILQHITLDPASLSYREAIVTFLREAHKGGRRIVLTTASDERIARPVADYLGVFDDVLASDGTTNLKGETKLRAIRERIGDEPFDYMGDSSCDVPLFEAARQVHLVGHGGVRHHASVTDASRSFVGERHSVASQIARAMRPRQWVKNVLLFVPLLAAHRVTDVSLLLTIVAAFFAFSFAASAVYILNDLLDLPSDRRHPRKRQRPFASGKLPILYGPPVALALIILSFLIALITTNLLFVAMLGAYLVLTSAYSLFVKRMLVLDVVFLAGLYTHRIIAGGVAVDLFPTFWLLAFSMFLFVSLAFAKRYTELLTMQQRNEVNAHGRGYGVGDLELVRVVGPAAGYLAVLVFCLYIHEGEDAARLYERPILLWFIAPVFLYWITRLWFIAQRGNLHDDPIVFALTDKVSYLAAFVAALLLVAAKLA